MSSAIDLLFLRTWWTYQPGVAGNDLYRGFNLVEGCFWLLLAAIVLVRYLRRRHSGLEVCYALSFVAFACTDFREANCLQSWLILAKGVNLAAILFLRRIVLRQYYPGERAF